MPQLDHGLDCLEHHIEVQIIKSHFFLPFSVFFPTPFISLNFGSSCLTSEVVGLQVLPPHPTQTDVPAVRCQHWLRHGSSSLLWLVFWPSQTVTRPPTNTYNKISYCSTVFHLEVLVCEMRLWKMTLCRCEHTVWESEKFMIRQFGKGPLLCNITGLPEKEAKLVRLPYSLTTCSVSSKSNFSTPHSHPWQGH